MADIFAPVRSEPLFDDLGNPTIRFADYLELVASNVNAVTTNLENDVATALEEVNQTAAVVTEQAKELAELQQVSIATNKAIAEIGQQSKRIDEVDQLSCKLSSAWAEISDLKKEIKELKSMVEIVMSKADITALTKKIKELEALV